MKEGKLAEILSTEIEEPSYVPQFQWPKKSCPRCKSEMMHTTGMDVGVGKTVVGEGFSCTQCDYMEVVGIWQSEEKGEPNG